MPTGTRITSTAFFAAKDTIRGLESKRALQRQEQRTAGQYPLGLFLPWSASESAVCPDARTFLLETEAHSSASSGNANGLTRLASSRVSLLFRSSPFRALAARARTRFGNPNTRQNAARLRPFHRLSDESVPTVKSSARRGVFSIAFTVTLHLADDGSPLWIWHRKILRSG
jgi:hypothetical protein